MTPQTAHKASPDESRHHQRLQRYWDELRAGRPFPAENEVDSEALAEVWRSCFLISIDDVTRRLGYRYSYLGEELFEAYGADQHTPDVATRLLSANTMPMVRRFDEVVKNHKPVIDEDHFVNLHKLNIKYRSCMLPLGRDGKVTHIIGCMRWKAY